MCVIVHKERGKDLPSDEVIEKCFKKNPDGSGILLHRHGTKLVEIHKGFMKLDDFKTAYKELNIGKDDDLVLHFRISTSGGTNPENCHPFPISSKIEDLKATRINVPMAFVHNGVLGSGDEKLKISDTQVFVRDVMSRSEISDHLDNEEIQKIISEMSKNQRFFIADAGKDLFKRFGTWYEDNGLWFSNMYWKSYGKHYTSWFGDYGSYDYYGTSGYGNSSRYGSSWNHGSPSYYKYGENAKKAPDVNSILCPYCDREMELMMKGHDAYMCPDCGTVYNDKTFEIYDKPNGIWVSIVDMNDFDEDEELAS